MKIIYIDKDFRFSGKFEHKIAATMGFFDGVHRGHRFLIDQLKDVASKANIPSAIITFPVHPRKVLQSDFQPELLNGFEEKLFQLSTTGADYCFVLDFTKELAALTAEEFIREKLRKAFHVDKLVVGYDHKFGKGRTSDFKDYKMFGEACGMEVIQAEQLKEENIHISSTTIRKLLSEGNVKAAAEILSYNYTLEGVVIEGNKIGREMGFPTANIKITEPYKVVPASGIYATLVQFNDKTYKSMGYIGTRPTIVEDGEQRIEVNLFDFTEDLYNQNLRVNFVDYIRDDMRFDTFEELQEQLRKDKEDAQKML